ncbi:MAG: four helix bundle protein [Bacteroidia bacterium]|nr:four helix bundle protein [Bacteroidia bacterium]
MERDDSIFRFEELRVYQKALDYVDWVYSTTKSFSNDDLSGPFRRASQEIALNIAEGSGENKSQFITNLRMAKAALRECVVYTSVAKRQFLISETVEEESRGKLIELSKMLSGFITSLLNKERANATPTYNS